MARSLGDTASNFTSWTSDYETAHQFATNSGTESGVVLTRSFARGAATPAATNVQEMMGESEYLVSGGTVTTIP